MEIKKPENQREPVVSLPNDMKIRYRSYQDELARFVERDQLLDAHLWERFIAQFREQKDGTNNGWRGEYFGKMLRGGCLTWQYTRSSTLYRMLEKVVMTMIDEQEESGRISSYSRETEYGQWDLWSRKYVMLGMEYFYDICRNERLKARILRCVMRQADEIMRHIGAEKGKKSITDTGVWGGMNGCSILEPYVRLYRMTGKAVYRSFAEYIISIGFCADANLIELVNSGVEPYRFPQVKAYEMMSCFEGLLEYALLMGREDYIETVVKFADSIHRTDVTVIGCCGCTHELFDHSTEKQTEYRDGIMQETCVTVTWMKLCFRLLQVTGEQRFADWIEQSALNAMSGAVNDFENKTMSSDSNSLVPRYGQNNVALTFDSYSPLVHSGRGRLTGGYQMISENENYGCCACIGSAGTAIANLYGVLAAEDGIMLNIYQTGKAVLSTPKGQKVAIRFSSKLPKSGKVTISLMQTKPEQYALFLRIPSWSKKSYVRINEEEVKEIAESGRYFVLDRTWKDGDRVTLQLDVAARAQELDGKFAIVKAGYVLARDARFGEDYGDPVALSYGKSGRVLLHQIKPTVRAQMQFRLLLDDGTEVPMIDYASAGKNWSDPVNGVNVWMSHIDE